MPLPAKNPYSFGPSAQSSLLGLAPVSPWIYDLFPGRNKGISLCQFISKTASAQDYRSLPLPPPRSKLKILICLISATPNGHSTRDHDISDPFFPFSLFPFFPFSLFPFFPFSLFPFSNFPLPRASLLRWYEPLLTCCQFLKP
jgi:hypothetical protein